MRSLKAITALLLLHTQAVVMATESSPLASTDRHPGGSATYTGKLDRNAFSHPSANLSRERKLDFMVGNGFFKRLWVSAPASTQAADGLGPLYNARSCQRCHINDGRGHPPEGPDDHAISMLLRLGIPANNNIAPEPTYGRQLQDFAIQGYQAEGKMQIRYETITVELADGQKVALRKPHTTITNLGYGPLHPDTLISPRVAPQMIGLGLLEAIAEKVLLAQADPEDVNGDGISGKPNQVWSPSQNKMMLGRFGWKAGVATIDEQVQAGFAADIGISVPLHPNGAGECTEHQSECQNAPHGNSPQYGNLEADNTVTDLVSHYSRHLAVPARRHYDDSQFEAGKRLFRKSGCASCHTPGYVTGDVAGDPALSHQPIWPFTDLLLHDMGEGLADNRPEGEASGREWRTAPLWGVGLTPVVNGHSYYLHDGRARSLLEAILWHGGEAEMARNAVIQMSEVQRQQLLRFVESL